MKLHSGLDESALDAYLFAHLPVYAGPYAVSVLSGGQSNPTFLLEGQGKKLVLRKKPGGILLPSAHAVDREYRVISALRDSAVPVAQAECYCEDEAIIGTPFYVMEFVQGRQFMNPALPELVAEERGRVWNEFNRVIAALHCVNYDAVGLGDYGRPGNFLARQIARWSKQYRASETERIDTMERLIEWLPANVPPGDDTAIVHGDLRIDNLIFHSTEPRILAVLDWELSTLGHPLADLAYHAMSWRLTSEQFRGMAEHDLAALGIPSEAQYLQLYCQRTQREPIDAAEWEFHMAFSMFRLAAILQGIVRRALDGNASSSEALATGQRARTIADAAWLQVEKLMTNAPARILLNP
ncbi:MAG: aminoglycoside phosphotransferase [Polaromonas sp.]|nr:aminoglycoside phosphotransferase [Polaromonas sp.]